ncbi:hypothetical protein [Brevundimonas sp.]|uniref:hypothetical protein n=1 Tax=Brevundimonas sp. TaxID=1871086 RepID=UPI003D112786
MSFPLMRAPRRTLSLAGAGVLAVLPLAACGTTAESRQVAFHEDARTCSAFGSDYGSRAYSECMLEQQRRRDEAQLKTLEEMRLTSEIAREGQIMADQARRERCRRDPDRRECRRGGR